MLFDQVGFFFSFLHYTIYKSRLQERELLDVVLGCAKQRQKQKTNLFLFALVQKLLMLVRSVSL